MRIDIDYIKILLEKILDHDEPDFTISIVRELWDDDAKLKQLVFHMELMEDQGLIESSTSSQGVGFGRLGGGNGFTVSVIPLRLTSDGHDFAAALIKPGVFESLTSTFKDLGPSETIKATFKLGAKAFENQVESLIGD